MGQIWGTRCRGGHRQPSAQHVCAAADQWVSLLAPLLLLQPIRCCTSCIKLYQYLNVTELSWSAAPFV